jgi:hypothetical protein
MVRCHKLRQRQEFFASKIEEMNSAGPLLYQQVSCRLAEALLESIANQIVYPSEHHSTVG